MLSSAVLLIKQLQQLEAALYDTTLLAKYIRDAVSKSQNSFTKYKSLIESAEHKAKLEILEA